MPTLGRANGFQTQVKYPLSEMLGNRSVRGFRVVVFQTMKYLHGHKISKHNILLCIIYTRHTKVEDDYVMF